MSCPPHPADRVEVRWKPALGGGRTFAIQCLACGSQVGRPIPVERLEVDPREVRRWDAKGRRSQPNSKRRAYQKALKSPHFRRMRRIVLERAHYTCQWPNCEERATEVDHVSYERLGEERAEDLRALCHEHNLQEREERVKRQVLGT